MTDLDMNLLPVLDALLAESSVTGAARRLGLSTSAMSRALSRLRAATGDPLLVRAGRGLVPTPRAIQLRDKVHDLARDVRTVLSPQADLLDVASLERIFTIRANEGFINLFSAPIAVAIMRDAPGVRVRFAPKPLKDALPLRGGDVDLEIGVLGAFAPEVRVQAIFRDKFVGFVRQGHPLLDDAVTAERYAACAHVGASRRGVFAGPVDDALGKVGLVRKVVVVVPSFLDALQMALSSDLVALAPKSCMGTANANGLTQFELPVWTPEITISAMWHPRMEADPGHRWFRQSVMKVCRVELGDRAALAFKNDRF